MSGSAAMAMRLRISCCALLWIAVVAATRAAESPAAVHGSSDAFAAPGIALAWAVLRGSDETSTRVVIRIDADAGRYPSVAITGVDPFTQSRHAMLAPTALGGVFDFRAPRAHFADFPRTELRFGPLPAGGAAGAAAASLVVFYLGIPDTTPEFDAAGKLDAYLGERIAKAKQTAGAKTP